MRCDHRPGERDIGQVLAVGVVGGSGWVDGPTSGAARRCLSDGVGELAEGRPPVCVAAFAATLAAPDVALEAFKEIRPAAGPHDEHVSSVVLISFAAQIAERAKVFKARVTTGFETPSTRARPRTVWGPG